MPKKLYVSGLDWSLTEDQLESAFAQHGEVLETVIIKHRDSGRSRGFGFVTFYKEEDAQTALNAMHGTKLASRKIKVKIARMKKSDKPKANKGKENTDAQIEYRVKNAIL